MADTPKFVDRALAAVDDAIITAVGDDAKAAWAKVAGGEQLDKAAGEFAAGLPKLIDLRAALRGQVEAAFNKAGERE